MTPSFFAPRAEMFSQRAHRIRELVDRALVYLCEGNLEDALMQLAPALEATAKSRYPSDGSAKRTQKFIRDERELIYGLSTQFRLSVSESGDITYRPDGDLSRIIYKFIRCAQAHEAQIDFSKITLGGDFGIAGFSIQGASLHNPPGKYLISSATVLALIFSVVVADESRNLATTGLRISLWGSEICVDDYLSDKERFLAFAISKFS